MSSLDFDPPYDHEQTIGGGNLFRRRQLVMQMVVVTFFVTVVAGAGFGVYNLVHSWFDRTSAIPEHVPATTVVYVGFTPSLSDGANWERLQTVFPELSGVNGSNTFRDWLQSELDLSVKEDIEPWLGREAAVVINSLDWQKLQRNPGAAFTLESTLASGMLIIKARDREKAKTFLEQLAVRLQAKGVLVDHKSRDTYLLYEVNGTPSQPEWAFGLVDDYVVLAGSGDAISTMATLGDGTTPTLGQLPAFQQVQNKLPKSAIAYIFFNGGVMEEGLVEARQQFTGTLPFGIEPATTLQGLQGFGSAFTLEKDGVRVDTVTVTSSGQGQQATDVGSSLQSPLRREVLQPLHEDSAIVWASRIDATQGESFLKQVQGTVEDPNGNAVDLEAQLGVRWEQDIAPWLEGDLAISILPSDDLTIPFYLYAVLYPTEPSVARRGMDQVRSTVEGHSPIATIYEEQRGEMEWVLIGQELMGFAVGGYSFQGDMLILALGDTALDAAGSSATTPLSADAIYQATTRVIPETATTLFYANSRQIWEALEVATIYGMELPSEVKEGLLRVKGVSFGLSPSDESGIAQSVFFLYYGEDVN